MIKTGDSMNLMKRMSAYSSNVTGSDAFWHQRRTELEATFEQNAPATVFFTFSYADNHWPDLHRLMPRYYSKTSDSDPVLNNDFKYQDVLNNPHLVDWYFSFRLNKFLEIVFDGILECEWRWHRYEWQSRTSIHAHGAARFKNDPGLIELTKKVYQGRLLEKALSENKLNSTDEISQAEIKIKEGVEAEKIVIQYSNTLLTCMNTRLINGQLNFDGVPDPHPCSLRNINSGDSNSDYEELANCVQRHVCRLDGYCKSKKKLNECRFGYPFKLEAKTRIEFTEKEKSVRADIFHMRNDEFMNVHNRLICHSWRANVDMQVILDHNAAINYMVKYATKCEKAGSSLRQLFNDVIGPASNDDNSQSKIRSLMVKSIAGKRDLGTINNNL